MSAEEFREVLNFIGSFDINGDFLGDVVDKYFGEGTWKRTLSEIYAWQTIETAPRDGTRVLVCNEYGVPMFVFWHEGGWRCQRHLPIWTPSYWHPLSPAPNAVP